MKTFILSVLFIFVLLNNSPAETVATFEGQIDLERQSLDVDMNFNGRGNVSALIEGLFSETIRGLIKVDHLNMLGFDISSEIQGDLDIEKSQPLDVSVMEGSIWSKYTLVDFKPVDEFSGRFRIEGDELFMQSLFFGPIESVGRISMKDPHKMDMDIKINSISMPDFLSFWMGDKDVDSYGNVTGNIRLFGDLDRLYVTAKLNSFDGAVGKLDFDSINLNLSGYYPEINITDSTVSRADGLGFLVEGNIDLSDRDNFEKQIKGLSLSPVVSDSDSKVEWTLKKLKRGDAATTEIKYLLRQGQDQGGFEESGSDMLGLERKIEF